MRKRRETTELKVVMLVGLALALLVGSSSGALQLPNVAGRRAVLRNSAGLALLPLASHAGGVPEGMKTSESYTNLQQISPETTGTLGAGTISSRSRPVTGVVLLEDVQEAGKKDAVRAREPQALSAERPGLSASAC